MQVTRLACGGFILACMFNHSTCDAYSAYQFMTAVSEFCKLPNRSSPSTLPTWAREMLKPRSPPIITRPHHEYDESENPAISYSAPDFKSLAQTFIFLSHADILALKCPTFDAVASFLWRARTRILIKPESSTRLIFPVDTRFRRKPPLPNGYYGGISIRHCKGRQACQQTARCKADSGSEKECYGDEYRTSVLDVIEVNGRNGFHSGGAFVVSDMSRLRFVDVDFGWGPGVYSGPARAGTGMVPGMVTSVIRHKNEEGVEGVLRLGFSATRVAGEVPQRALVGRLQQKVIKALLVSGGREEAVATIAEMVGIGSDCVNASLTPQQKLEVISSLKSAGHHVAMVGDAINEAPSLALADVGIALQIEAQENAA